MNPFNEKSKTLDKNFIPMKKMYPKSYNKERTSPYTKTRVILMNGTEFESAWFMHQFARHCDEPEILAALATVRRQEQQQQKRISCLKPLNESILETTIGYEQLAVDLTATLARNEKDENNIKALNFALLEDFDHLYRYANLLKMDKGIEADTLVGKMTEIMPGRPTIAEHRHPADDLKPHMDGKTADLYTKLVASTITAAEQQTMNYYMNIAQWYKNDLGRKLYAEIAMIEEAHVTQYESLKDPNMSWLEQWVLHEYCECWLYYSAMEDETDEAIKKIWSEHYKMEVCHLKIAAKMLKKFENESYEKVVGTGEFPKLLKLGSNKDYVRRVLGSTVTLTADNTADNMDYKDIKRIADGHRYFEYQSFMGDPQRDPAHLVIQKAIDRMGKDYRYQDSEHPVKELRDRTCDNVKIARTK
ncbi:MAG TPA: hypothetical protein IAC67_03190 [Candidatus Coproplasma excrementipullorum]|nr:hypothetical protein [Candidatus Coproplasma excrementipullorum]